MTYKKQKNRSSSYAESYKPALILNGTTLNEMMNQVYLKEQKEDYDDQDYQLLYSNLGPNETPGNPDAKPVYFLETADTTVEPDVRKVVVKGKEDYKSHSYVMEAELNGLGVAVVLLKEVADQNQVYCNLRFLPYSQLKDITVNTSGDQLEIAIPKSNVVKLNVTLTASNTGEILYKTHKTDVNLENTTEQEVTDLKQVLEFDTAQLTAHFTSLILDPIPNQDMQQSNNFASGYTVTEPGRDNVKQVSLWVGLSSVFIASATGIIAIRRPALAWQYASITFAGISGVAGFGPDIYRQYRPYQPPLPPQEPPNEH